MAFIMTRINVGDYDAWKPMFDQDAPRARESATGYRLFRSVENPGEVFIQIEFASSDDAKVARERLLASGVLDRFTDKNEPTVVEKAETVRHYQDVRRVPPPPPPLRLCNNKGSSARPVEPACDPHQANADYTKTSRAALLFPVALRPTVAVIVAVTDAFCERHLDGEYGELCRRLVARLARKHPSPLARGDTAIWAAGVI